jgi:hypothetical protein
MQTGLQLEGLGSIPVRGKIYFFSIASTTAQGPTSFPIQCAPGAVSLGVKRPAREADYSPPIYCRSQELYPPIRHEDVLQN